MSFTNGVHFIEIPHRVQPKILVLISNFFSLNFTSIEIEGEMVSSSQNDRTLAGWEGGWGECSKMNKDEQGGRLGGGGEVKNRKNWLNKPFECPLSSMLIFLLLVRFLLFYSVFFLSLYITLLSTIKMLIDTNVVFADLVFTTEHVFEALITLKFNIFITQITTIMHYANQYNAK